MNKQELLGWITSWYMNGAKPPTDDENEAFKTIFELIYTEVPDE